MGIVQKDLLCLRFVPRKYVILFNSFSQLVCNDWKKMKSKYYKLRTCDKKSRMHIENFLENATKRTSIVERACTEGFSK
jgi:hypothetical protein